MATEEASAGEEDSRNSLVERQSHGIPAAGRQEVAALGPTAGPGLSNWQKATVARPGLADRSGVYFAAAEMTRMPMVITDPNEPDNPIVFANGAFLDLTGYSRDEVHGRNCRFLQGPLTDRGTVRQLREALAEPRPVAVELLNYRKDGTPFWNALFIGPIYGPGGKLLHFFSSQLDVTRRHDDEDALRRAQRMEAIGELAAGLAHDFNNALHVVLGNLGRVETRLAPEQEEMRKALERAKRAGEHAAALTRQILTFARRSRLDPRPVALNAVIAQFGEALARALGEEIELRFELDPRIPTCIVDATQVEASLLNLLANARDAMLPNGGRATVKTGTTVLDETSIVTTGSGLKPGQYVILTVEDDGPGMPPEVLARSTEPFFTTKRGKGTGLGLAAVHGFARQSGGRLEISSAPGSGTTVRMLFPAIEASNDNEPDRAKVGPVLDVKGGTETVLVVDDEDAVLDLAVHHLTALGYRVLSACSGEQALGVLRENPAGHVDLLFSDVVMPGGMNGLVLADQAKALRPGLRVLLASGYSEELLRRGTAGAKIDVLAKPYRQVDLASRVRAALDRPAATGDGQDG
jgi:PAS domain S-box-containing protein